MTTSIRKPLKPLTILVAALAIFAIPAPAAADGKRTIRDGKFDNRTVSRNGRIDIVEASASRRGTELKHAIAMRAKVKPARSKERPGVLINTRGGRRSAAEFLVFGSTVFKAPRKGDPKPIGTAELRSSKRTWRFTFAAAEIPNLPGSYGWAVVTQRGDRVADIAPGDGYVNSPR